MSPVYIAEETGMSEEDVVKLIEGSQAYRRMMVEVINKRILSLVRNGDDARPMIFLRGLVTEEDIKIT